jgi:hypothetical protein
MRGQWVGQYTGTNTGQIMVDLDERDDRFEGYAYLYDNIPSHPGLLARVATTNKSRISRLNVSVHPVDPHTGDATNWAQVSSNYPGITFPSNADVTFDWQGHALNINWTTNILTSGSAQLPKSKASERSEYPINPITWEEFKAYVGTLEPRRYMFRGQEQPWRLRTSFHRTERADLFRFIGEDVQALHRVLSSRTRHIYDLRNADQNGSFFHLIQHHGYPTPLLDWTYSPFVAAFFAYRKIAVPSASKSADDKNVRIFAFDQREWRNDIPQLQNLRAYIPHLSILDFIAIDNDRMVPQQALSSVTNVDDVETFIRWTEFHRKKTYLHVIDIPSTERSKVIADLSFMGISAGSLFPGIDGSCEEIRQRLFPS